MSDRVHHSARFAALLMTACVVAALLVPVAVIAIPDEGGSVAYDTVDTAMPAVEIPASWKAAGFELACQCTTRRSAGRYLLSDDPHGCCSGKDCMVVKDGRCYQVPLPQ